MSTSPWSWMSWLPCTLWGTKRSAARCLRSSSRCWWMMPIYIRTSRTDSVRLSSPYLTWFRGAETETKLRFEEEEQVEDERLPHLEYELSWRIAGAWEYHRQKHQPDGAFPRLFPDQDQAHVWDHELAGDKGENPSRKVWDRTPREKPVLDRPMGSL